MAKLPINAEISLFLRNDLTNVESRHDSAIQVNLMALAALDYVLLTHLDCDHANCIESLATHDTDIKTACDRVVGLALLTLPVWSAVVIACFCLLPPRRVPHSSWVC